MGPCEIAFVHFRGDCIRLQLSTTEQEIRYVMRFFAALNEPFQTILAVTDTSSV